MAGGWQRSTKGHSAGVQLAAPCPPPSPPTMCFPLLAGSALREINFQFKNKTEKKKSKMGFFYISIGTFQGGPLNSKLTVVGFAWAEHASTHGSLWTLAARQIEAERKPQFVLSQSLKSSSCHTWFTAFSKANMLLPSQRIPDRPYHSCWLQAVGCCWKMASAPLVTLSYWTLMFCCQNPVTSSATPTKASQWFSHKI